MISVAAMNIVYQTTIDKNRHTFPQKHRQLWEQKDYNLGTFLYSETEISEGGVTAQYLCRLLGFQPNYV